MKLTSLLLFLSGLALPLESNACWVDAANKYGINPYLLYAIAKTESGLNPKAINHNTNGTYDIGLMQINSGWLPTLRKYGVTEEALFEPCTSIQVGAWILAQNIRQFGNTWEAVGAYNAHSPVLRLKYATKVYRNLPLPLREDMDQNHAE